MTLSADEFIRRFLFHVLSDGFQRISASSPIAIGQRSSRCAGSSCKRRRRLPVNSTRTTEIDMRPSRVSP